MSALIEYMVNFTVLTQMQEQYADTILHEATITGRHDVANRVRSVRDKNQWFIRHMKASLPRIEAEAFMKAVDDVNGMDAVLLLEHAMSMNESGRAKLKAIIVALKEGQELNTTTQIETKATDNAIQANPPDRTCPD
jgi:hypothetical protein